MNRFLVIAFVVFTGIITLPAKTPVSFHNVLIPGTEAAYCMEKDDKGVLWIGTGNGLYCYDGYRCYFKRGDLPVNPYGIQTMTIIGGDIYLGCDNGFYAYNIKNNKFQCLVSNIREVNAALLYGNTIYIGCKEGLWGWNIDKNEAEHVAGELKSVYAIAEYGENLLTGTLDGLYLVKNGKVFKRNYSSFVGAILRDVNDGFFWIGTEGNLFYYDANKDKLHPTIDMSGNYVKVMAFDSCNNLYIGTDNGLYVMADNKIKLFQHDSRNPSSIQNNIICDIYIDRQQNVWLGNNIGFSMIPYKASCDIMPLGELTGNNGGNLIYAISKDKDDNLWLGGTDGLIRYSESQTGNNADWYRQSGNGLRIMHNRVRDIYNDCDGEVWILTDHGINLYDRRTKKLINFIVENDNASHSCRWAYDIYMDKERNLWIAAFDEGVFVVNKDTLIASGGRCKADVFYGKSNGKLAGEHVYHITPDRKGRVWVSSNGGIDRINPYDRNVKHISEESATSMLSDNKGRVWTSFENGIRCYDNEGNIVNDYYFQTKGQKIRFVKLLELNNLVWAFTQNDCRIIYPDGHISMFSLPNVNVQTAYYSEKEQKVLLGGMDNLAYVDCRIAKHQDNTQRLILTGLQINGQAYETEKATAYIDELVLKYDENNIEFLLTDIPDSKKLLPLYSYNIEGSGGQWLPLSADKKITVNGLPHGTYKLVVCPVDGMGNRLGEVYSLRIRIMPPWYLSLWAKLIYLFLAGLLIFGVRHFYYVRKKLQEENEKRRKILEQQEMRSLFFRNLSAEIKKMLAVIIVPAEKLLGSSPAKELRGMAEDIRFSATRINTLIRQAFDLNNSKNSIAGLHVASIDVIRFCRGFIHIFEEKHPEFKTLKYIFQSEAAELDMEILIVRFDSVFNIFVSYLSRNTVSGGNVQMLLRQTADQLVIELAATPLAIDNLQTDRLFDCYNLPTGSSDETANSELYLAKEYVISMKGRVEADYSHDEKRLSFKIILPIDSEEQRNEFADGRPATKSSRRETKKEVKAPEGRDNENSLATITSTIEKHISDFDFNVSMLQFELNIGEKTLYRRIKQLTGLTPVEYIRHIRMNRAALLLKEGNFTVSEVMYMVGFSNSGYFSKCFQSIYEITPAKYKQKWGQVQK